MNAVVLEVRSLAETLADASRAMKAGRSGREARIGFATPELLWQVLTAKRWDLLKAMCGWGPMSIRDAARRVGRDVKAVHGDVTALLNAGVLNRTANGEVEFPFEAVKSSSCCRQHNDAGVCELSACVLQPNRNVKSMKKANQTKSDELRPEYKRSDFGETVRGKYASRAAVATNVVVLDQQVAKAFPTDEAVNQALQSLIDIAKTSTRPTRRSSGRAKR